MRWVPAVLAIVAVLLSTVSAWTDSITIAGKTYLNVKVFESASRYYFRDENGRVVSVSKSEVRPGEVNIGSATDPETSAPDGNPSGRIAPSRPIPGDGHTFSVEGYHGGYFFSNPGDMDAAFAKMFDLLEKSPSSRISLEIEAYTLERMLQGGSLESEKGQEAYQAPELLKRLRDAVIAGQVEIVGGTYSQPLWSAHDGEGWVRQFLFGTRAVKKALGVDVKTYAAQEACFISQIPQILNGFEYKGCLFRVHWAPWGDLPAFNHDSFLWEGPDGARIVAIPRYSFDVRLSLCGYGPWDVTKAAQAGIRRPLASRFDDFETKRISPALDGANQTSPWAALAQEIQAGQYQGKTLSFSGWIRSSAPAACLMMDFGDPAYMFVEAFVANDGAWHRVELKFNVPLHARFLYPQVRVHGSAGDAAFDGLSLVVTGDSRELLQNGSFETGDKAPANWGIWRQDGTSVETSWLAAAPGLPGRAVGLRFQGQSASFIPVTVGEFISTLGRPEVVIHDPTSRAEQRWAWGILGGELERKCRRAQRLTEAAERAACLSDTHLEQNVSDAWRLVLMANHHDTLCCFPMQFGYWSWSESETYADLCREWTSDAESRATVILRSALGVSSSDGATVTVFNPIPQSRSLVLVHAGNPANGLSLSVRRVGQTSEEIRSESVVLSTDGSGKPTKAMVAWPTELPPLSSETFQLAEAPAGYPPGRLEPCQSTVLENEFYRVSITSDSGIVSLFDKRLGCELLGSPAHFAAFFPDDQTNARSSVSELRAYQGRLLGLAEMRGRMGAIPFEQRVLLKTGSHAVEIEVEFDFGASCRIGAATDNVFPKTNVSSDFADETQKLRFVFPSAISLTTALSDNSYDVVTASKSSSWAVSWAAAEGPVGGIGLLVDRSSAFRWNSSTLELVLAYGNRFMIGPESGIPLSGRHRYTFALTSYGPNWEAARLPELAADFDRPVVQIDGKAERSTFLPIGVDGHVITGAMYREDNVLYMRLFNPYTTQQTALIKGLAGNIVSEANLQGAVIRRIASSDGQCTITVPAKRLVTLRIENEQ